MTCDSFSFTVLVTIFLYPFKKYVKSDFSFSSGLDMMSCSVVARFDHIGHGQIVVNDYSCS